MGTVSAFAAWIVYWALHGSVPTATGALISLLVAGISLLVSRMARSAVYGLEIGSAATFLVLTLLGVVVGGPVIDQWSPTLSYVGLFVTFVYCAVAGKPPVREMAVVGPPTDPSRSDEFVPMRATLNRIWMGATAGMTVVSALPAIAAHGSRGAFGAVFQWAIPIVAFTLAALASRTLYERALAATASPGVVRRTSFVAFRELAIDELYYLAREKVEREVGAGMEAYDVNIGSSGVPLTGDESRESWPATYKVRERR